MGDWAALPLIGVGDQFGAEVIRGRGHRPVMEVVVRQEQVQAYEGAIGSWLAGPAPEQDREPIGTGLAGERGHSGRHSY